MRPAYFPTELAPLKGFGTPEAPLWSLGVDPDLHDLPYVLLRTTDRGRTIQVEGMNMVRVSTDLKDKQAATKMCSSVSLMATALCSSEIVSSDGFIGAVESQHVLTGRTRNPEDLILLAEVAGAAKCVTQQSVFAKARLMLSPLPEHWKRSAAKHENQRATWRSLGYEKGEVRGKITKGPGCKAYWRPQIAGCEDFKISDWQGLGDAAGIALWALKEALKA